MGHTLHRRGHSAKPDRHDWDASWGSSVTSVTVDNWTHRKIVIGHDKMGNIIAMDGASRKARLLFGFKKGQTD